MENKLYRDENRKVLGGVCAGLADYFNMDDTVVRLIFVFANLFLGLSFWVYIILWIVMPAKYVINPGVDYVVPPQMGRVTHQSSASTVGVVLGLILIAFGGLFLLNEYDLIPDIEYYKLWPVILIIIGLGIIFSAGRKKTISDSFDNRQQPDEQDGRTETFEP